MSWRVTATLALVVWGALAFGAVYPWAFTPLFAGCVVLGVSALMARTGSGNDTVSLAASLTLLIAVIVTQLIPIPVRAIQLISPGTDALLQRFEVGYAGFARYHALSIEPSATRIALAGAGALAVLILGLSHALDREETRQIVRGVCVLGVVLSLAGIVQKAMWNGKIYGFWTPVEEGLSFGPFVNRNHFAGWMLMAMPLAAGYLCGRVVHGMRHVGSGLRNRVIWFSSAEASETLLIGFAVLLMALSVTLTTSRSGILGLLGVVVLWGWLVARRRITRWRRAAAAVCLAGVVIAGVAWAGTDRLAERFADADTATLGNRVGIWDDTLRIARDFPLVGTGLNTYGTAMLFYQTAEPTKHYAQAHNDYLQLLAEGGLLVVIPALVTTLVFAITVRRRFRDASTEGTGYWIRLGAVTGIVAIALQEIGDFSLQMPGNAALFCVLCAIAAAPAKRGTNARAVR